MKRLFRLGCGAIFCAGVLHAKQLKLDDGNVVMTVPDDFTALDPREIKSCFPTLNGALLAVGDSGRIMFVALDLASARLYSDQLGQIQASYPAALTDHIPGVKVIADQIVSIDGADWLRVEFIRPTRYGAAHWVQFFTSYHGRALSVHIVTSDLQYMFYKERLEAIPGSVKFHSPPDSLLNPPSLALPPSAR